MKYTFSTIILIVISSNLWGQLPAEFTERLSIISDKEEQVDTLNEWAWEYLYDDIILSLDCAQLAAKMAKSNDYKLGLATAYYRISTAFKVSGGYPQAISYSHKGLVEFEQIGDEIGQAKIHNGQGNIYRLQKQYRVAEKSYQKALAINTRKGRKAGIARNSQNLGLLAREQGKFQTAKSFYYKSLYLFIELENKLGEGQIYNNLGALMLYQQKDLDSAAYYFERSMFLAIEQENDLHIADANNNLGLTYLERNEPRLALEQYFLPASEYAKKASSIDQQEQIAFNTGLAYEILGLSKQAMNAYALSLSLRDSLTATGDINSNILNRMIYVEELQEEQSKTYKLRLIFIILLTLSIIGGGSAFLRQKLKLAKQKDVNSRQKIQSLVQAQVLQSMKDLAQGQMEERKRIAKELHNRLGNTLAGIYLQLQSFKSAILDLPPPKQVVFEDALYNLNYASNRLGDIAGDLDSNQILKDGLVSAIQKVLDKIQHFKHVNSNIRIDTTFDFHGKINLLPGELQIELYDIIIELINNTLKYAEATSLTIQILVSQNDINIIVSDDGIGFKTSKSKKKTGYGLTYIENRVNELNGKLLLDTHQLQGTTVSISLPIQQV